MIVRELIELLELQDPDHAVKIEQPAHNHNRQSVACSPSNVEVMRVRFSAYLDDLEIVGEDDVDYEDEDKNMETAVIIA